MLKFLILNYEMLWLRIFLMFKLLELIVSKKTSENNFRKQYRKETFNLKLGKNITLSFY
jgi:hypothetical protein